MDIIWCWKFQVLTAKQHYQQQQKVNTMYAVNLLLVMPALYQVPMLVLHIFCL